MPKEKFAAFHRANILSAAEKLFAAKGFQQTTIDDIARAADCSRSTLYVYFQSKDEIYNTILYTHMQQLRKALAQSFSQSAPFEASYYAVCARLAAFYEQCPLFFSGVMEHIGAEPSAPADSELLQKIDAVGEEINDEMVAFVQRGIKEGSLRKSLQVVPTVFVLWSSLGGLIATANEKADSLKTYMQLSKKDYLQYGFTLLLHAVKKKPKRPMSI